MRKFLLVTAASLFALSGVNHAFAADLEPVAEPVAEAPAESSSLLPGEISGSIGLYSDYRFRGISQTDGEPSVQGTIDYSVGTGIEGISLYLGAFGANIDFTPVTATDDGSVEFDFYGGLSGSFNDINWAVGGLYFFYPDADSTLDQDFFEGTFAIDTDIVDNLNVGLAYHISPDFFGGIGVAHWIQGTASYSISAIDRLPLTLDGSVGYQEFEGAGDYVTWQVGLTAEIHKHLDIGIQYIDTNLGPTVFDPLTGNDVADATVLGFLSAKF